MNNKKYMVLFVLLFVTLLSCAVITAADTTNNVTAEKTVSKDTITQKAVQTDKNVKNINTEKTKTIEKKVEKNKKEAKQEVVANSYNDLYNYVEQAKTSDDEYVIKYTAYSGMDPLISNSIIWNPTTPKTLTITGNGTVDADENQFLTITQGNTVIIKGLTVKNAKATNGAAIYNSGTLVVENSTFVDNSVTKKGGAIYSEGTLTVTNSTFKNNKVTEGKNSVDDGGVAIFTKGKLVVKNSTFEGNVAKYVDDSTSSDGGNGGAIQALDSTEDFIILDSTFKNNEGRHGGAIIILDNQYRNLGNKTIAGCNFTGNKATYGGAIETYATTNISKCKFEQNSVGGYGNAGTNSPSGGAILINGKTHSNEVNIEECEFKDNSALNQYTNAAGQGSAVYIYSQGSDVTLDHCEFTENSAYTGGTIYVRKLESDLTVKDSTFTDNTVVTDGVTISPLGSITVENVEINGINVAGIDETGNLDTNVADYAALYSLIETIKTTGMTENITATLTGTEYTETQPIVIDDTFKPELLTINGNGQSIDAVGKQFLTIAQGKAVTINNLTVKNANAVNGAAVYNNGTLTVENSVFKDNTASYYGGAIYSHKNVGAKLTVNNTEFLDNKANVGAAIFANLGSTLKIDETNFTGNRAINASTTGDGGAIYVNNATVSIFNTNFKQNYANVTGGAIGAINSTQFEVFNTNFTNNEAYYGGAVYSNLTLNMDKVLFESNTARGEGAAIFTSYGKLTVNDAIFDSNIASTRGGAISNAEGTLNLLNSKFINNQAQNGGAIYNTFKGLNPIATISIINDTFTSNKAQADGEYTICSGGAIWTNLPLSVKGSNFTDNSAREGGAIYTDFALDAYNINVDESKFTSNTATKNGGAIYTSYPTAITNSNFKSNAAADGSAIYVCPDSMSFMHEDIYADVSIESSIFDSNVASENGTLYVDENTQLSAKDSTFTDNQATTGSVVYQSGTTTLDTCTINDNPVSEDGYLIANDEATSLTLKDNTISHNGADLVNTDVQTKTAEGNTFAQGNVIVEIAPISDVTIIDTEETTNIPVTLTIDEIYGITSIDDAHIKVTVNEDVQNAYSFPVSGTGSTIAIPVSDLSANNAVVVELVSDSGTYTLTPESLSFSIQKLITTQLSVNAANIYAGDNVNISGTLQKGDTGIAQKTIKLVINDVEYTTTTDDNGYFKFTDLIINDVTSEVVVSAKFVETGYIESSATDSFAVLERPSIVSTSITVDAIEGDLHVDDKVTLTSYVKDDLGNFVDGGFVIFKINGKTLRDDAGKVIYVQVDNGKVQLPDVAVTQEWAKEGSKIQAYYTGTDGYDISVSAPVSVSVVKHTAVVDVSDISGVAGQDITIKATVTSNGAPVPVGRVAIKIDGKTLKDADGKALYVSVAEIAEGVTYKLPAKIKAGTHTLSVVFTDPTFDRATDSATLTVSKEQT